MIYTSGRNLLAIVNEVLDFSMLEQKVFELMVSPSNIPFLLIFVEFSFTF